MFGLGANSGIKSVPDHLEQPVEGVPAQDCMDFTASSLTNHSRIP